MNILGQHVNPQEFTWVYYPLIRKSPRSSQTMKQWLINSSLNRYLRKLESQSFNWFLGKIKGKLYNHCLPSPKVVGTFSPQLSQVQQQCLTFDIDLCQHYYTSLELDNFWRLSLWILQVRWNILVFYSGFFCFSCFGMHTWAGGNLGAQMCWWLCFVAHSCVRHWYP